MYMCRWILCSDVVEDINLDGNWIGDGGGRELVLALQQRKEGIPHYGRSIAKSCICILL